MQNLTPRQVEILAIQILEHLEKGVFREDSLVELKRELTDPYKIARRIAGHCNAARGDWVLWIIGADENDGVVGWSPPDLAEFLPKIWRFFDGYPPSFIDVNVEYNRKHCTALAFNANRPPYLVRNESFGNKGVFIEREIPWRDGTRLRSATRDEVIRLLVDQTKLPDIEILSSQASQRSSKQTGESQNDLIPIDIRIEFYAMLKDEKPVVLPIHRISGWFSDPSKEYTSVDIANFFFQSEERRQRVARQTLEYARNGGPAFPTPPADDSVRFTGSEAIIYRPTNIGVQMSTMFDRKTWEKFSLFEIQLVLPMGVDRTPLIISDKSVRKTGGNRV